MSGTILRCKIKAFIETDNYHLRNAVVTPLIAAVTAHAVTEWPLLLVGRKPKQGDYQPQDLVMQTLLYYSTAIAVLAVFLVLLLGLRSMLKGTSPNLSQKLMRWRVGLQFCAVVLIVAYALLLR